MTQSDRRTLGRVERIVSALQVAGATSIESRRVIPGEVCAALVVACATSNRPIADSLADPKYLDLMLTIANEVLAVQSSQRVRFGPADYATLLNHILTLVRTADGDFDSAISANEHPSDSDVMTTLCGPITDHARHLMEAINSGDRRADAANLDLLATYERTDRLGTPLNAVVALLKAPKRREDGPLHGVAIAIKDFFDIKGVARGHGNPSAMAGHVSDVDAPVVASLREAGADVYATTTMLEYAAVAMHSDIPEAMNPSDHTRTAGGSSGGSAALVGAGACEVSLGTDTGGSVRIPAHYCGVVGFKPSYDALSRDGVQPFAPTLDHVGLFGRNVDIVERVFSAITGSAVGAEKIQRLQVGVDRDQVLDPNLTREVRDVVIEAIARIGRGADVFDIDGRPFAEIRTTWDAIILHEAWQTHGERVLKDPGHYGPETLRFLEASSKVSDAEYANSLAKRTELLPYTEMVYRGLDVVITPIAPYVAPVTMPTFDTPEGEIEPRFSAIYNVTGAPAIVLPCGFDRDGLPIGLQLSAAFGDDMDLLRAATRVESLLTLKN